MLEIDELIHHILYFADETILPKVVKISPKVIKIIPILLNDLSDYYCDYRNLIILINTLFELGEIEIVNSLFGKIYQQDIYDFNSIFTDMMDYNNSLIKLFITAAPVDFNWENCSIFCYSNYENAQIEYYKKILIIIINLKYLPLINYFTDYFNETLKSRKELEVLIRIANIILEIDKINKLDHDINLFEIITDLL